MWAPSVVMPFHFQLTTIPSYVGCDCGQCQCNKISTIPRRCHPAAIIQMVMDGLRCPLSDAMQSERGACSYICICTVMLFYIILCPILYSTVLVMVYVKHASNLQAYEQNGEHFVYSQLKVKRHDYGWSPLTILLLRYA